MSQINSIIKAMQTGWRSTKDLIDASGSLTPLARLAEWREHNADYIVVKGRYYMECVYRIAGFDYEEKTRTRKVTNRDGVKVQIIERRLVKVK